MFYLPWAISADISVATEVKEVNDSWLLNGLFIGLSESSRDPPRETATLIDLTPCMRVGDEVVQILSDSVSVQVWLWHLASLQVTTRGSVLQQRSLLRWSSRKLPESWLLGCKLFSEKLVSEEDLNKQYFCSLLRPKAATVLILSIIMVWPDEK